MAGEMGYIWQGKMEHRLISRVDGWVNRKYEEVNYSLTQMLSNHGCFKAYLHRFKHEEASQCPAVYPRIWNMYSSGASALLTRERNWKTQWDQHLSQKLLWNGLWQQRKSGLRSTVSPQLLKRDFEKRSRSAERRGGRAEQLKPPREIMLSGGSAGATKGLMTMSLGFK